MQEPVESHRPPSRRVGSAARIVLVVICCAVACVAAYWLGITGVLHPSSFRAIDRALDLEEEGRFDEAIDWCNRVLSRGDDDVAYEIRGNAYNGKGDVRRAIADYTFAIELNPDYASMYAIRAKAYEKAGDLRRATKDYCRAILTKPGGASGPHSCAAIRASRRGPDTLDEMIAFFERALEAYPADKEIADSLRKLRRAQEED